MTAPMFDPPPSEPRRKRSAGMWIVLLFVWMLGVLSFVVWCLLFFYFLIRVL